MNFVAALVSAVDGNQLVVAAVVVVVAAVVVVVVVAAAVVVVGQLADFEIGPLVEMCQLAVIVASVPRG